MAWVFGSIQVQGIALVYHDIERVADVSLDNSDEIGHASCAINLSAQAPVES